MISLLTSIAFSSSRILIGHLIWTGYSKFGLIMDLSKIQFEDEENFDKHIGVVKLCQAQGAVAKNILKITKIYIISN